LASLFLVLVLAKAIALAGHRVTLTLWSPPVYLWQDAAVVLVAATLDRLLARKPALAWGGYGVAVLYVAVNVPVTRVLSTPLTWAMLRAARGPLADSIWLYVTWPNALLFLAVIAFAAIAPVGLRRVPARPVVVTAAVIATIGALAQQQVPTFGLERNAWSALVLTSMPRSVARTAVGWQATGFETAAGEDLTWLRGAAAGRNVVLVSLESTSAQYLGLYGSSPDPMPRLSELARSGIVFDNAYAVYPESIKGLFSILCSTYPAFDVSAEAYANVPCDSLAGALGRQGYRTGLFHSGRFAYLGMESVIRNRGFDILEDAGDIGGNRQSSFGVDEPSTVARALQWIDGLPAGRPFFLTYLPVAGHHPYEAPEGGPFPDTDAFGRYRNALRYGDAALGALADGVAARGLRDRTLWIILGDHGEAFGQHDGNYGHTFQLYEENVHVPLLIVAPGLIPRQVRSAAVLSLIDTAPAVLDLVGAPASGLYQGRSFLEPDSRLAFFFADYSLGLLGLRDGPRKVIYEMGTHRPQVFDLARDPGETKDVAAEQGERTQWYVRNLRDWSAAQRASILAKR
jgi:hypothetical protein